MVDAEMHCIVHAPPMCALSRCRNSKRDACMTRQWAMGAHAMVMSAPVQHIRRSSVNGAPTERTNEMVCGQLGGACRQSGHASTGERVCWVGGWGASRGLEGVAYNSTRPAPLPRSRASTRARTRLGRGSLVQRACRRPQRAVAVAHPCHAPDCPSTIQSCFPHRTGAGTRARAHCRTWCNRSQECRGTSSNSATPGRSCTRCRCRRRPGTAVGSG